MKVILNKDIAGTGKAGDIIDVPDGYARNFLLKKNLAVIADKKNINDLNGKKQAVAYQKAEAKKEAMQLAEKLKDQTVTICMKAGTNGKLFGSVTMKDVSEAIFTTLGLKIDKKKLSTNVELKSYGYYTITAKFMPDVIADFKVMVTEQQG
ncbi:MAG: 50S ribosomal protein L9 [Oscillospiraceae bacterium]